MPMNPFEPPKEVTMRIVLCVCLVLAGCGLSPSSPTDAKHDELMTTAADLAEQARLQQVSEIAERNDKEVDRLIKEGQAAGMEDEIRAAVGRLIIESNARLVSDGDLSAVTWFEQQVSGKTPAQLIAAFPGK